MTSPPRTTSTAAGKGHASRERGRPGVAGISSHRRPSEPHGGGSPRIAPDPGADGEGQVPQRLDDRPLSADRLTQQRWARGYFPRLPVLRRQGRSGTADCTRSGNGWAAQWPASCCCSGWDNFNGGETNDGPRCRQWSPPPDLRSETMDGDAQARARIIEHWRASEQGDSAAEHAIYAVDAILAYPQSGNGFAAARPLRRNAVVIRRTGTLPCSGSNILALVHRAGEYAEKAPSHLRCCS